MIPAQQICQLNHCQGRSPANILRWVFSSELPRTQQSGHSLYDPSKSDTAQELQGATWNITYGDGSGASGNVYTDTVDVGGTTVTGQAVELGSQISDQFQQDENNDGLLGLAFSSINTGRSESLVGSGSLLTMAQFNPSSRLHFSIPPSPRVFYHPTSSPSTSRRVPLEPTTLASSMRRSTLLASPTPRSTMHEASGNSLVLAMESALEDSSQPALMPSLTLARLSS